MVIRLLHMHGTRNEFLVWDGFRQPVESGIDLASLAVSLCDRETGFNVDGLLVVEPVAGAAARMTVYNADGSIPEMCGNGLRCVGKMLVDRGHADGEFVVETGAGPRRVEVTESKGTTSNVRISLGRPIFEAAQIPTTLVGNPPQEVSLSLSQVAAATELPAEVEVTCVSMGNPHAVIFVDDDPETVAVDRLGPIIERHPAFPRRTNVEFVSVISPGELSLRVWERGCGETMACGTGTAAAVVAGVLTGRCQREAIVHLRGGDLKIEWPHNAADVMLSGEAVEQREVAWDREPQQAAPAVR